MLSMASLRIPHCLVSTLDIAQGAVLNHLPTCKGVAYMQSLAKPQCEHQLLSILSEALAEWRELPDTFSIKPGISKPISNVQ